MGNCVDKGSGSVSSHDRAQSVSVELGRDVPLDGDGKVVKIEQKQNGKIDKIKGMQVIDRSDEYNHNIKNGTKNGTKKRDKEVTKHLKEARRTVMKVKKCLLLGSGSSGKSTLFRQLKCIHGNGPERSMIAESKHVILTNCVMGILTLLKKSQELFEMDEKEYLNCFIDLNNQNDETKEIISNIHNILKYQSETWEEYDEMEESNIVSLGKSIQKLWKLPQIQETFKKRQIYSLIENMDYFFDRVDKIFTKKYSVSLEDHLKARIRTTGMIQAMYTINEVQFHIFDVGGQRNERKKWIQLFDGVTAVLFVAALNHYAAVLFEDECKNAMAESLQLFEEIANSKWFKATEIILFLNKDDLFRERIKEQIKLNVFFNEDKYGKICSDESDYYEEYKGDEYEPINDDIVADQEHLNDIHDKYVEFIQAQYDKRNLSPYKRVFVHVTTATDKENVQRVFWDVQNIVINSNLRKGGLV